MDVQKRLLAPGLLIVIALALSSPAAAAPYTFTTIDVPGSTETRAFGINEVGQIVGESRSMGSFQGFVIDADGTFHTITVPGALDTRAQGSMMSGMS